MIWLMVIILLMLVFALLMTKLGDRIASALNKQRTHNPGKAHVLDCSGYAFVRYTPILVESPTETIDTYGTQQNVFIDFNALGK